MLSLVLLIAAACKKDFKVDPYTPSRMFTPGDIRVTAGETQVQLEWNASLFSAGRGTKYTVEVSQDVNFAGTPAFTTVVDTARAVITDANIAIRTDYYARVRANATGSSEASYWVVSSRFRITGEQIFLAIADADLKDVSVILKWRAYAGLTKIVLTRVGGASTEIALTAGDVTAAEKQLTGLTPNTDYSAEIFQGTLSKGTIAFRTKEPSIFTTIITPADNLVVTVANAANGDVIGLQPGTYNCTDATSAYVSLVVQQKNISIQSVSNNPANTIVNFREVTLKGTGAGISLKGITFDGAAANAATATPASNGALYFLNLTGNASDGEAANFSAITIDNCVVKNMGNCFMRANRGTGNGDHKIGAMKINNSIISDCKEYNAYTFFTLDKLVFTSLELTNSTFYTLGRSFIGASTNFTMGLVPSIVINQCTFNNFGSGGTSRNNIFIDCNSNPVTISVQNSIIANTPISGQTVGTSLARATGATSASISYTNMFKLTDGAATPATLTIPSTFSLSNNKSIVLSWTGATTDFSLPAGSELRTSSSTGGPVGDPRWAN